MEQGRQPLRTSHCPHILLSAPARPRAPKCPRGLEELRWWEGGKPHMMEGGCAL